MKEKKYIRKFIEYSKGIIMDEKFLQLKNFTQHGDTSVYEHVLNVSFSCFKKAYGNKKYDINTLVRACLLHDYFLYDWHASRKESGRKGIHGYTHPSVASENAKRDFDLSEKELKIIRSHMWPLTFLHMPTCREGWLLCSVDKSVSLKETFSKEVRLNKELIKEIEKELKEMSL